MSSDFNKASPGSRLQNQVSGGNGLAGQASSWEGVPVSDVRLTAEEAEERFMSFVEQLYPEELHWLFAEINKMAMKGGSAITFPLVRQPRQGRARVLPGYGSTSDIRWKRIEVYLGKLGYSVSNNPNEIQTKIDWSNPRRLHE